MCGSWQEPKVQCIGAAWGRTVWRQTMHVVEAPVLLLAGLPAGNLHKLRGGQQHVHKLHRRHLQGCRHAELHKVCAWLLFTWQCHSVPAVSTRLLCSGTRFSPRECHRAGRQACHLSNHCSAAVPCPCWQVGLGVLPSKLQQPCHSVQDPYMVFQWAAPHCIAVQSQVGHVHTTWGTE